MRDDGKKIEISGYVFGRSPESLSNFSINNRFRLIKQRVWIIYENEM